MNAERAKRSVLRRFRRGGGGARTTHTTVVGGLVSQDGITQEAMDLEYEAGPGEPHTEKITFARVCKCRRGLGQGNAFLGYCHHLGPDGSTHTVCQACSGGSACAVCGVLCCPRHRLWWGADRFACSFAHVLVLAWRSFWRVGP